MKATTTCLLVAVLAVGGIKAHNATSEVEKESTNIFSDVFGNILGKLPGRLDQNQLVLGLLNGMQGDFLDMIPKALQNGLLEYPGNLFLHQEDTINELKSYCLTRGNQTLSNQVEQAYYDMQVCLTNSMPSMQLVLTGSQKDVCLSVRDKVHNCTIAYANELELCMDNTTIYLIGYNVDVWYAVFNFLCNGEADDGMTLLLSLLKPNNCVQKVQGLAQQCMPPNMRRSNSIGDFVNITKKELCSDTLHWRDCVVSDSQKYCSGYMNDFVVGMANAVYESCSGCQINAANLILLIFILCLSKLF